MALSQQQIDMLKNSMESYDYPAVYFNCDSQQESLDLTMTEVELRIKQDLISEKISDVRRGLVAVIYWGFKQMGGLAPYRTNVFLNKVKVKSLERASLLFCNNSTPSLIEIKKLELPQFSAISFTSKIRMFLSPEDSAVLDSQILKMRKICDNTVLDQLKLSSSGTSIRITKVNNDAYENWCNQLREIRDHYFPQKRVVDIERAFFELIQKNRIKEAAYALRDA